MSISSNRSGGLGHRIGSSRSIGRPRPTSRMFRAAVSQEEAFSYALRVAFLHHLLQPRARRKQYVAAPKPPPQRSHAGMGNAMQEFVSSGVTSMKLPHGFRQPLLERMQGVLRGTEKTPGYSDPPIKRCFAEAYTAFTEENFKRNIDKERKMEPLILIFYSSATKAAQKTAAPNDDSWKLLPDRHVALFVRLVVKILIDQGHDRDKPALVAKLSTLENKLLTNDQNLVLDPDKDGAGSTIEVVAPLSYDVKDMAMVQSVLRIFGYPATQAQSEIDANRTTWTEEAALRDLKTYQHRLNLGLSGALRSIDFDVDDAFEEWKKSEATHLSQVILEILKAKPALAKTTAADKPLPAHPSHQSSYSEDQSYADLGRIVTSPDAPGFGLDPTPSMMSNLSLDEPSSIRSVDEAHYTFIPHDPRAFYMAVVQYAMTADQFLSNPSAPYEPLSKPSVDLLTVLSEYWRVPRCSALVALVEVAARKLLDGELEVPDLNVILDTVKCPGPELKKPPHISDYNGPLSFLESSSRWPLHDVAMYQQALRTIHEFVLTQVFGLILECYAEKPPSIAAHMQVLVGQIQQDPAFTWRPEEAAALAASLERDLRNRATLAYRSYLDKELPANQDDWDFGHVVRLGKSVIKLADKIRKRYKRNPEILGVNPLVALVETAFPVFELDAKAVIEQIMQVAKEKGEDVDLQDGFLLYKELVELRKIHQASLPNTPFAFSIEDLLVDFVWRWIRHAESTMESHVEEAIKQDQFQVRVDSPDAVPLDSQRHSVSIIDLFTLFNQSVNQIFELAWDNDEHYARFMTALSKSFASGIAKYCEIVEQRFAREMDRPTAQEAAAASRTTQEKFLQYAKDAWVTKEKAEPFQFYPESFVKLNNVEYAMQELDKLEKTMNVDACADVLQRIDGPHKPSRRTNKYVFTVKIVEAEDLKACDATGFSDPYVVLGDEYQKRLAKTRIIYRNLNPRWDESIDITVQGPLNIIATIWDYDTFGDHDFVGRTSLKLDPIQFSDYLPREFWLDLDTQGRLLLRVSMEGERDDIQFYFGKAFRHLKRTERDMVRKVTEKLSTYINATLSLDTLRTLLRGGGISASVTSLWKKRASEMPTGVNDIEGAIQPLFDYFNDNFAIMKQTLADATMLAVMTRLWKEVLMAIENLLVPPLSDKPSTQRPLTQKELDIVYRWLQMLFEFFNAKDESGEQLGVPADMLKSPKWHELASLNFFYHEDTDSLIRESERMATATVQRAQTMLQQSGSHNNRLSAPPTFGAPMAGSGFGAFASMGTIRRGKSIMMSRNLGTMRRAKEERRKEAQADPSDDMILRILRMRPEATSYLRDRHRQKERQQAAAAAALIVKNSVNQGWNSAGGGAFGRNNLPRR